MATAFQDTPDAFQETTLAWQIEASGPADDVYNYLQMWRDSRDVWYGRSLRHRGG